MESTNQYSDDVMLRALSQSRSPSRKELLFKHIITEDKSESLMNAYKVKHQIAKTTSKPSLTYKIDTNAPIVTLPEGKYNHATGARISPITMSASKVLVRFYFLQFTLHVFTR
jgi:hypothetical protein